MLSDSEHDCPGTSDHVATENQCVFGFIKYCFLIGSEYMDVCVPVITEEDDEIVTTAHCLLTSHNQ